MIKHTPIKTLAAWLLLLVMLGLAAGCHKKKVEITPDLAKRIERVRANCDAEIIR